MWIGPQTERLIKSSLKMEILSKLSGARIFHELCKMLEDERPVECFKRLQNPFKILSIISPNLEKLSYGSMEKAVDVLKLFRLLKLKEEVTVWKFFFLVIVDSLSYLSFSFTLFS